MSIEIVIIALGTVLEKPILFQILVVSIVAVIATIGVYGIVALIVRMDDLGYRLIKKSNNEKGSMLAIGKTLVQALPIVIKSLSVIGTIALILVAGGIFTHNIEFLHHFMENMPSLVKDAIVGLAAGFLAFLLVEVLKKIYKIIKA